MTPSTRPARAGPKKRCDAAGSLDARGARRHQGADVVHRQGQQGCRSAGGGPASRNRGDARQPADRPAGPVAGTYEKSVPRLPDVIAYALSDMAGDEAVVILLVIHTTPGFAKSVPEVAREW